MILLKNKGYIYKVTNIITRQFYIGQRSSYAGTPEDDLGFHYFTSSKVVKPLFRNNTSEWQKEILYRDIQYAETLNDMEGYAIHKEIKDPLCMNRYDPSLSPGWSMAGKKRPPMSAETRAKIGASHLGKHLSAEARAKIGAANRGRQLSAEQRARLIEIVRHPSEETRAKMSAARRGKHSGPVSEAARTKIGAAHRGRHLSLETRERMREGWKHRAPMSEETRAKMSTSHRGKHHSEEWRAKQSAARKGKHHSEETRARMSTAAKERWAKSHNYNNTKETNDK